MAIRTIPGNVVISFYIFPAPSSPSDDVEVVPSVVGGGQPPRDPEFIYGVLSPFDFLKNFNGRWWKDACGKDNAWDRLMIYATRNVITDSHLSSLPGSPRHGLLHENSVVCFRCLRKDEATHGCPSVANSRWDSCRCWPGRERKYNVRHEGHRWT